MGRTPEARADQGLTILWPAVHQQRESEGQLTLDEVHKHKR